MPKSLKDNMNSTSSLWQDNYTYHKNKGDLKEFIGMRYRELHNMELVIKAYWHSDDDYLKTIGNAKSEVQKLRDNSVNWKQLSFWWNKAMKDKDWLMKKGVKYGDSKVLRDLNRQITKLKL